MDWQSEHTLPRAVRPLVAFPSLLRENAFAVSPEQTMSFVEAVGILGPEDMSDLLNAARATLAPPPERNAEFDALFRMVFLGQSIPVPAMSEDEDELLVADEMSGEDEPPEPEEQNEAGGEATSTESLTIRQFASVDEAEALRRFRRAAPTRLPMRASHRRVSQHRGRTLDMRRAMRAAVRNDGEVFDLPKLARKQTQRRIILLIDISGSMKQMTDDALRFAHAMVQASERIEVFTIGTRLTRVTRALRTRNREQALSQASGAVSDWDGGTRLGDALHAFLDIPRFSGFARGALALVVSDGLERGDHSAMTAAVERLSRLSWKLAWMTPLATGSQFDPETEAMMAIRPFVDHFGNGSSINALCAGVLRLREVMA